MERMLGWLFALMSATENFQRSRHNDPWSAERKMREQEIAFALLASCLTVGLAFFVTSLVESAGGCDVPSSGSGIPAAGRCLLPFALACHRRHHVRKLPTSVTVTFG